MDGYIRIIFAIVGFSSSFLFCLPNLKKWQKQQTAIEKLRLTKEVLEEAENRLLELQERHDRLLKEICSYYLCHRELEAALVGARRDMNEAMEFVNGLRKMQVKIISSYPDDVTLETTSADACSSCRPRGNLMN
ncbi:hypothetical protein Ancab_000722 [Ancistrocladus abbreviatus]